MNNILDTAKKRIEMQNESKAKEFAISVCFADISSFINYYTIEAIESNASLGGITDLYLNKIKNRLFDCVLNSELNELLTDCIKAKGEFFNRLSNLYEHHYKREFNFFSFKPLTFFDWGDKSDAIINIKYYLAYKNICEQINKKLNVKAHPQFNSFSQTDASNDLHSNHDPNLWNVQCFELFKYLHDNYYKSTNRQLTNIWFFLKECKSNKYVLKATKDQYVTFIQDIYKKKITNFEKATNKWEDKECQTINEHRINFESNLK